MPFLFTSKFSPGTCRSHASSWDATTHDGPGNASPWYASTGDATQRATWDAPSRDERSAHNLGWFLMLIGLLHVSHKANKLEFVQDEKSASETCSSFHSRIFPSFNLAYLYIRWRYSHDKRSQPFSFHFYIRIYCKWFKHWSQGTRLDHCSVLLLYMCLGWAWASVTHLTVPWLCDVVVKKCSSHCPLAIISRNAVKV